MDMNRRQFFKVCGIGLGGSSLAALGMAPTEAFADQVRHFKLAHTVETRNTCTYCSVGCGLIMYSQGDGAKNVAQNIIHIEGDADHPVNRGTLCPKARRPAGLHPQPEPPEVSGSARGRLQRVEAHRVGRSPRAHRQADEGRPRRQLRREERAGPDRQPLVDHRLPRRVRLVQRGRLHHPQGDALPRHPRDSTTRRVSDTARRWQVLPRRLAVEP